MRVLEGVDNLKRQVDEIVGKRGGHLHIAISPYYEKHYLSGILPEFQRRYPSTAFSIIDAMSDDGERLLLNGNVDLAFIIEPVKNKSLRSKRVYRDHLILVVPANSDISRGLHVEDGDTCSMESLHRLRQFPFVMPKKGRRLRKSIHAICKSAGFDPICSIETESSSNIAEFVRNGCGVGIIPEGTLEEMGGRGIAHHPLNTPISERNLAVTWNEQSITDLALSFTMYAVAIRCVP